MAHVTRLELARVAPYAPQAYVSAIPPHVHLCFNIKTYSKKNSTVFCSYHKKTGF